MLNASAQPMFDVNTQKQEKIENSFKKLKPNHLKSNEEKLNQKTVNSCKKIDKSKANTSRIVQDVSKINFKEVVSVEQEYNKGLTLQYFNKERKNPDPDGDVSNENGG